MITTNVDRAIQLLGEKGSFDTKEIAKALGTNQDSVDLILSYLEEEGLVELKYGVFHTTATLKKQEAEEKPQEGVVKIEEQIVQEAEEEAKPAVFPELKPKIEAKPLQKPVQEKPKPEIKPKPVIVPKQLVKRPLLEKPIPAPAKMPEPKPLAQAKKGIPLFDEEKGARAEKRSARLANMMIKLLEKSREMKADEMQNAEAVLKDILKLAKNSGIYKQKDAVSQEFTLCSLIVTMNILLAEHSRKKDIETAKKIYLTYSLARKSAMGIGKQRLSYYKKQITGMYIIIMKEIYPALKKAEAMMPAETVQPKPAAKPKPEAKPIPAQPEPKQMPEIKPSQIVKLKPAKPAQKAEKKEEQLPKLMIPRLDSGSGTKDERDISKLTNTMISLLEKFYSIPEENRASAILVLNDILKLAKQINLYHHKNETTAEFILCSLIIGIETLMSEHKGSADPKIISRINSTYHLAREVAMETDTSRLENYKPLLQQIYKKAAEFTFASAGASK